MRFEERYLKNKNSLNDEQQELLSKASVLVLGCGGLGGYIIEFLARIGVGHITMIDQDVFQDSNLNRQLLCTQENIGLKKAEEAVKRIRLINEEVEAEALCMAASKENAAELVRGKDVVIDAFDNAKIKLLMARAAAKEGVPFVHGAISGWTIRVHTALPGDELMEFLCGTEGGTEKICGNLGFTAGTCAALEAAEAVKTILNIGKNTASRLVEADLLTMSFDVLDIK